MVKVADRTAPVISLKGNEFVSLSRWADYADAGFTVCDNYYSAVQITVDTLGDWVSSSEEGLFYIHRQTTISVRKVSLVK